jgi:hypothetical protein
MFDTKKRNTSKLMVFIVTIAFMLSGVPVRFSGKAEASRPRSENVSKPSSGESRSFTVQSGTTYDKLLQDNSSGDQFRFKFNNRRVRVQSVQQRLFAQRHWQPHSSRQQLHIDTLPC